MSILVTGASGFVGRRLCRRLESRGHAVVPFDLPDDVADAAAVDAAVARARPEAVVHLAAVSHVPDSLRDPALTWRVNYAGASAVLAAAHRHGGARVLLVGSSLVYGPAAPGAPAFTEQAPLRPETPYAWTKAAADRLGATWARRGLPVVCVRPFNHTGAGRPASFVESSFARQLACIEHGEHEPVLRVGNLDAVRDFLHVEDVIDAYVALLDPGVAPGVYNVASGRGVRIGELLERLIAASPAAPRVEVDPQRHRPTEASVGDASRLATATGWRPRRPLDQALSELLGDWRTRLAQAQPLAEGAAARGSSDAAYR